LSRIDCRSFRNLIRDEVGKYRIRFESVEEWRERLT
jgi:hypothetical protein